MTTPFESASKTTGQTDKKYFWCPLAVYIAYGKLN